MSALSLRLAPLETPKWLSLFKAPYGDFTRASGQRMTVSFCVSPFINKETLPKVSGDFPCHMLLFKPIVSKGEIGLLQVTDPVQIIGVLISRRKGATITKWVGHHSAALPAKGLGKQRYAH